jgi:hypothetical protein
MPDIATSADLSTGSKTAAMTVRLFSQYTGRGPTKARTVLSEDMVTVVLQDTLTKAEQTLVANDHRDLVHRTRATLQEVMAADPDRRYRADPRVHGDRVLERQPRRSRHRRANVHP